MSELIQKIIEGLSSGGSLEQVEADISEGERREILDDAYLFRAILSVRKRDYSSAYRFLKKQNEQLPPDGVARELISILDDGKHQWVEDEFSLGAIATFEDAIENILIERKDRRYSQFKYPKITLITPVFNQKDLLKECMHSVLSQDYPNLEYVVMDGGSTDGSQEVIKEYESSLAFWKSGKDGGPYSAINQGFADTDGSIMGWLNADDLLHPNGLFNLAEVFTRFPDVDWASGRRVGFNEKGIPVQNLFPLTQWTRNNLLSDLNLLSPYLFIMQEATFWRRSLWDLAGGSLDLNYELAADYELWARFSRHAQIYQINLLTGGFRDHSTDQRSRLFWDQYVSEVKDIILRESKLELPEKNFFCSAPNIIDTIDLAKKLGPEILPAGKKVPAYSTLISGPSISLVTIAASDKSFLQHCLESVAAQPYESVEHFVIDVEPTSASKSILALYSEQVRVIDASTADCTVVLNQVLKETAGEIMHWSTAATLFDPICFAVLGALFSQNPEMEWLNGRFFAADDCGNHFWYCFTRAFCRKYFMKGNFYDPLLQLESVFWKRSLWERAGATINQNLKHAVDIDLWLRFSRYSKLYSTPHCLAGFHWPHEGPWTRRPIEYVHEVHRVLEEEKCISPNTPFDGLLPPPQVTVKGTSQGDPECKFYLG